MKTVAISNARLKKVRYEKSEVLDFAFIDINH